MREIERLVLFLCNRLQPLMNIIRDPRHSVRAIEPHTDWLRAHIKRRCSHQYVLLRLHSTDHRPCAKGSRWTGRDGAERCAGYTLSVGKVQCVAETAVGRRNRDPLPSRHPSQTYTRAVRQWPSPLQLFSAPALALLISRLPAHRDPPGELLRSAGALWICNLLVFACWYWRLDAGGPHQRALRRSHTDGAFLFPQMVLDADLRREMGEDEWRPGFVDYLFLAFNTSTAFSPTDVPVLSRWAKVLMMVQASISLATIAILAARAVNIL